MPLRPFVKRLERREKFDVGKWRSIAAVIRPAMLGNHGDDFGMAKQNLPHFSGRCFAVFAAKACHRHGSANPEIALFQVRQKLAAEPRPEKSGHREESDADGDRDRAVIQREAQRGIVKAVQDRARRLFRFPSHAPGSSTDASTGVTVNVAINAPASA